MLMDFCLPAWIWELCKTEPRLLVGSYLLIRSKAKDLGTAAAEQTRDWSDNSSRSRALLHWNAHISYPNMKETKANSREYSVLLPFIPEAQGRKNTGVLEVQLVEKLSDYCETEDSSWRSKSTQIDHILNQSTQSHSFPSTDILSFHLLLFLPCVSSLELFD